MTAAPSGVGDEELALHILFVCTGNLCRSPIAERLAVARSARFGCDDLKASSAGTYAVTGSPIEANAVRVLERLGGDAANFSSRRLTPAIAEDADLVLTMTRAQRDDVLNLVPRRLHETFTLGEAAFLASECSARNIADLAASRPRFPAHRWSDVPDPIGQDEAFFVTVGEQIDHLLAQLLEICRRR
jgi:protein-tyrosine phosphatase